MAATDYDFLANRNEIIAAAYRKIGVLSFGQEMDAEQLEEGVFALNLVVQDWENRGVFLWCRQILTETLVAATATYTPTDPAIIAVERAFLRATSDSTDDEIEVLSLDDYMGITNKTDTGRPRVLHFNLKQSASFTLWPIPDAAAAADYTLVYLGVSRLKDWDTAGGSGDIPSKYQRALVYDLAVELAPDHAVPSSERDRLQLQADNYFKIAKGADSDRSELEICSSSFDFNRRYH